MGKLLDSVQNYFKNGSKEQFLKDWEELKHFNEAGPDILEVINRYLPTQPLFTLTAEEVEVTEVVFNRFILDRGDLGKFIKEHPKEFEIINNIIHRLKAWEDERV